MTIFLEPQDLKTQEPQPPYNSTSQDAPGSAAAPGPIWTPLIPSTLPPEQVKTFGQSTPLGRAGQPAELAPVYVLLASPAASYITGQVYGVTGGDPLI